MQNIEINFLCVFIGSGFGGMLRYGTYLLMQFFNMSSWCATFICNIIGSFLIALIMKQIVHIEISFFKYAHPLIMIGILGGFTTFSTFALDSFKLYEQNPSTMFLYIFLSLGGSLGACFLGAHLGNHIFPNN